MKSRTIATKLGEITYIPELLDWIERYVKDLNIDEDLFLRSMGFLFVNRYIESRDDLSATYTDEFAGELLIETERFMESCASSHLDKDFDVSN